MAGNPLYCRGFSTWKGTMRATVPIQDESPPMPEPAHRRFGRLTLDIRQQLSPWKQSGFLAGSLAIGLAISVGVLAVAGIAPGTLIDELAGTLNADSLRAVLVQAAPLVLVGLGASLAFRIGFWNLGLEGQMIFGGIAATGVSIYPVGPEATRIVVMGIAAAAGGLAWVLLAGWFVHLSRAGFYMRFISANASMSKVLGVPIRAITIGAVAASGAAAG